MNGLINRAIQCFVRDTYGVARWDRIARGLGLGTDGYGTLLTYENAETERLIACVCDELGRDRQTLLEDLGTYLGSHETTQGIRRLLRFCGETFTDFLHALYDLPSRAQLAMPGLVLPELEVREDPPGQFRIFVLTDRLGWGDVVLGLLRAMADDYGALVLMERGAGSGPISVIEIKLLDGRYAEGRGFSLGGDASVDNGSVGRRMTDDPALRTRAGAAGQMAGRSNTHDHDGGASRDAGVLPAGLGAAAPRAQMPPGRNWSYRAEDDR